MIDLSLIKTDPDRIRKALESRNVKFDLDELIRIDEKRRELLAELEKLNQEKNKANDEISALLRKKEDAKAKIESMKSVAQKIDDLRPKVEEVESIFANKTLYIPNIPSMDCPIGKDAAANKVVNEQKYEKRMAFKPKTHIELAESLGMVDFKRAAKISGASFLLFTGDGARIERALINFMLDTHTSEHGYLEISPPHLVKRECMQGTGQLPKFEEDMYRVVEPPDMFLIPTAEVPVTNMHRDEILSEAELPLKYVAYTPCFRLEAGAYGQDTKGMVRVHQFDKVELVKFARPEASYTEHERLVQDAVDIFKRLEITYRVVLLSTGDLGFAAAKCYDIEIWAPGLGKWLEASSCSNFEDFQARRAGIRFKDKASGKNKLVHTLNGSGVALARTFAALLETYQQADGSVLIPDALRPYMAGKTHIKR